MRRFRYLDLLTIGFVVVLLISNLIGPKICQLGPLRPSAAEFLFPLTYICGDVFTEGLWLWLIPARDLAGLLRHGSPCRDGPACRRAAAGSRVPFGRRVRPECPS
jgi:hypothetical protein